MFDFGMIWLVVTCTCVVRRARTWQSICNKSRESSLAMGVCRILVPSPILTNEHLNYTHYPNLSPNSLKKRTTQIFSFTSSQTFHDSNSKLVKMLCKSSTTSSVDKLERGGQLLNTWTVILRFYSQHWLGMRVRRLLWTREWFWGICWSMNHCVRRYFIQRSEYFLPH